MTINDGTYDADTAEQIEAALIADAKEYFGEDLNDTELATIRRFYRPIAERLAETQGDIGLVLESSQIDHASGTALELLTALIGVRRDPSSPATGIVKFSRDSAAGTDYTIPSGTTVQTDDEHPVRFTTDESAVLKQGDTSVSVSVTAESAGPRGNVGANTVTDAPNTPSGVESITNPGEITGGTEKENDDELRARAKEELAQGSRASAPALINSVKQVDGVTSVSIFVNDGNVQQISGTSNKGFELIVAGGNDNEVGEAIMETKAAADTSFGGYNGTNVTVSAPLGNGQTLDVDFSRPAETKIYVDAEIDVTDEFTDADDVRDEIVSYIGGMLSSGQDATGIGNGDDVVYGEVEYAVRSVKGVYDVTSLTIGTSDPPGSTSNLTISDSEVAISDATDSSIEITTTEVSP
jgi:uncharacterized phage protein gp47/JayE